jgi:hypothetical protein
MAIHSTTCFLPEVAQQEAGRKEKQIDCSVPGVNTPKGKRGSRPGNYHDLLKNATMQEQTANDLDYFELLLNRLQQKDWCNSTDDGRDLEAQYTWLTNDVMQRLFEHPSRVMKEQLHYMAECCRLNQQAIALKQELRLRPAEHIPSYMVFYLTLTALIHSLDNLYCFYRNLEEPLYEKDMSRKEYIRFLLASEQECS